MTHKHCSAGIAALADEWQAESKKHALAALEGDCDVGDEEWCLHRESARIYRKCADQLIAAVSRGILDPAQSPIEPAARFLLDRLQEFDPGDFQAERDFHGHVAPAIARLRSALSSTQRNTGGQE